MGKSKGNTIYSYCQNKEEAIIVYLTFISLQAIETEYFDVYIIHKI